MISLCQAGAIPGEGLVPLESSDANPDKRPEGSTPAGSLHYMASAGSGGNIYFTARLNTIPFGLSPPEAAEPLDGKPGDAANRKGWNRKMNVMGIRYSERTVANI